MEADNGQYGWVREFIDSSKWIFARTMADIPHWYCLLRDCEDRNLFLKFVRFMEEHSVTGTFCGKQYRYFYLDGYRYWHMDPSAEECDLINRCDCTSEEGWEKKVLI